MEQRGILQNHRGAVTASHYDLEVSLRLSAQEPPYRVEIGLAVSPDQATSKG